MSIQAWGPCAHGVSLPQLCEDCERRDQLDVVAELRAVQLLALQGIAALDDEHEAAVRQAVAQLVNKVGAIADLVLSW